MSTFLVIEDSITIRKLVELAFRGSSVAVDFASSGSEGLAKIKATSPRVVLIDYVLPDMKGIEICTKVAAGEGPPPFVIVMSARMEEVRQLFAPFSFVTDFVSKPFKAADIVERVMAALSRDGGRVTTAPAAMGVPSVLPTADREAAAFALFAQLRPRLAQIPTWAAELGDTPPAKFYARRILTPEVVDRLLESLLPVLRDRLRKTLPVADEVVSDVVMEGRIGSLSPYEILAVAQRLQRTGEVVIGAHGDIVTFLRDGKVVLATSRNPTEWLQDLSLDLSGVPAEAMRKAVEEQSASGKPVLVTLAELGSLPPCDLSGLLNEQGKRVLKRVLGRLGPGTPFAILARATLPLYVDAYGRGVWFRQVVLERLRDDPSATGELVPVSAESVFERRGGFSKRLLQFELVPSERRVLALVDGNATVRSIAERTALGLTETCEAVQRLEAIELLGRRDHARPASEAPPSLVPRQVVILEPDVEGFQRPLERLLAERPGTYTLVPVDQEQDVFTAIRRVRPALVIMNVTAHGVAESARTARAVRGSDELRDLLLVAVQDLPSDEDAAPLSEAGFDAVLSKPVCYSDIERLLVA
jgi:DNA-binding response OmpR family regulator